MLELVDVTPVLEMCDANTIPVSVFRRIECDYVTVCSDYFAEDYVGSSVYAP